MNTASALPEQVFLFPLSTVLFPGGQLPLKVFEQRYLEMAKICLRDNLPFGISLIKEGRETGTPAVPETIGCLAHIRHWEMPQLGVFQLLVEGGERFQIINSSVAKSGLISVRIKHLSAEGDDAPHEPLCGEVLKAIIDKVGGKYFPPPYRFDSADWIGYRLSEVLPFSLADKQQLLQMTDPQIRLSYLSGLLAQQGVGTD